VKKYWAIGILIVIAFVFFSGFIFSDRFLFGTDYVDISYFSTKFYHDYIHQFGSFPLWEPHLHGGLPFHEGMHGAIFFPLSLPFRMVMAPERAWGYNYLVFMIFAGIAMYILLRFYKLHRGASFLGAIAYMLSPVIVSFIYAGHDGRMSGIAMLPFMVWLLERALARRKPTDFLFFSFGYVLYVLSNHLQMVYFGSWLLATIFVFRLIRAFIKKEYSPLITAKVSGMFISALVLALGMSAFQVYPPFDYLGKYSQRTECTEDSGVQYSNSWRMNIEDFASAAFPDFVGLDMRGRSTYWGRNVFRLNSFYIGILTIILALVALVVLKKPILYLFAGFSAFAVTYCLGTQTPLFYLYYYIIPNAKKFRGPEMLFFTVFFSVVIGMAFAIDAVLRKVEDGKSKKGGSHKGNTQLKKVDDNLFRWLLWFGLGFFGIMVVLSIAGKPICEWWLNSVPNYASVNIQGKIAALGRNFPIFLKSSWIALAMSWAGIGILLWRLKNNKLSWTAVTLVLGIILLVDMWRMSKPFMVLDDIKKYYTKSDVIEILQSKWETEGPFRTFSLEPSVGYTYLGAFGLDALTFTELHGNQLRWYNEFTGRNEQPQNIQQYPHFWDILNVKYVLSPQEINFPSLIPISRTSKGILYFNKNGFPRARSFHRWETSTHDAALAKLKEPSFAQNPEINYWNVLLVESEPEIAMPNIPDSIQMSYASGKIIDNEFDDFKVEIDMPYDGLLFLSQNWYPAWHAEENGKGLSIIRANYSFIAVPLEAGNHTIHFFYNPIIFKKSILVSIIFGSISLFLLVFLLILDSRRNR